MERLFTCRKSHGDCDQVSVWVDFAAPSQAHCQIQEEAWDAGDLGDFTAWEALSRLSAEAAAEPSPLLVHGSWGC